MSEAADRARWNKLQAQYREASKRYAVVSRELHDKYRWSEHPTFHATKAEREKLDAQDRKMQRALDGLLAIIDADSPRRGWRSGVPTHYIGEGLTFDDVISRGQIKIPPASFGGTEAHSRAFAAPLAEREPGGRWRRMHTHPTHPYSHPVTTKHRRK